MGFCGNRVAAEVTHSVAKVVAAAALAARREHGRKHGRGRRVGEKRKESWGRLFIGGGGGEHGREISRRGRWEREGIRVNPAS